MDMRTLHKTNTFQPQPIAQAIALVLAMGGLAGTAHAQRAFSPGWMAQKNLVQGTAAATGRLPNGMPASMLTNPLAQQQQAQQKLQRSISNLNLAAQSIAAQQAAQAAARQAALNNDPSVPDGLAEGGLEVDTNSLTAGWINAKAIDKQTDQTVVHCRTHVAIQQTADKAILNWETFNVGKNTTVDFQQQKDWSVLNRVNDPLARPSQIQGQIKADGTVLIVNRNGIVFSGSSQINTRNLGAAATKFTDSQFRANGIYSADGATPSFTDAGGNVMVQAGAQLNTATPDSVTQGGGYVLLMGKEVHNAGQITTPRGQAELAAGDSFVIRHGYGTDSNDTSTTRGNEIAPLLNGKTDVGTVENTGLLMASEGDITLAGHDVRQNGVAVATTTVNQRGTIHLLNSAKDATGRVALGADALTAVVLQDDGATALDSQRSALIIDSAKQNARRTAAVTGAFDNLSVVADREDQSRIEIVSGHTVDFAAGGLTLATGGQIAVGAAARAQVEDRAVLDVSGAVGVSLAMSSNNVKVNIQGNEQRDAPLNRNGGKLNNSDVWIDTRRLLHVAAGTGGYAGDRYYTGGGLLEVGGYLGTQGHTIGEWAGAGGTITLSGKEVVTRAGALLNLAGGSYDVQSGSMNVSWVRGADGRLYTVDEAPADVFFNGVYKGFEDTHKRWGDDATGYFRSPLIAPTTRLESGYTVGRDAGQLIVSAPTAVLDGAIDASVYEGPRQTKRADATQPDNYLQSQFAVARPAGLALGQYTAFGLQGGYATDVKIGEVAPLQGALGIDDALPQDRVGTAWLDAATLNADGLGSLNLATTRNIAIEAPLQLAPGARIMLTAPIIDIAADITAPSGSLAATNMFNGTSPITTPDGLSGITVEEGVHVDLRGLWTNALIDPTQVSGLAYVDGGSLKFDTSGDIVLSRGSVIDVSSGAAILAKGKTVGGKGGDVSLVAGDPVGGAAKINAVLNLDGTLRAMGVTGGGKLQMSSPSTVLLGSEASIESGILASGTPAPVDLALGQPLTIPAGQALPMSANLTFTTVALDVPVPVDVPLTTKPDGPTAADWTLPSGIYAWNQAVNQRWGPGDTVPAGTFIGSWGMTAWPAGTAIPSSVFPHGVPIKPYSVSYTKGQVMSTPVVYPAGTRVVAGSVLPETVAVQAPEGISSALLRSGFASYDINSSSGILVSAGMEVAPLMPVYRFTDGSKAMPTGSDPAAALEAWLPPLYTENPADATLTQRGGASLALRSVARDTFGLLTGGGPIEVQQGATLAVDPGQAIALQAFGQITVDGSLIAHGGSISLTGAADGATDASRNFDAAGKARGVSLWIGDSALLDVSGRSYQAIDAQGRAYGRAGDGGSIALDGNAAFVVLRPGARLDADGASVDVDIPAERGAVAGRATLAGNGGAIEFSSYSGIYLDGNFHAQGAGPGAAGGSLSMSLYTPNYVYPPDAPAPANRIVPSVVTLAQTHQDALLPAGIAPGSDAEALAFGQASLAADQVRAGGFDTLSLFSGDFMRFSGDVRLALGQSLKLSASAFTSGPSVPNAAMPTMAPASGSVVVSAPYVLLQANQSAPPDGSTSGSIRNPLPSNAPTLATFEADADQLDIQGPVVFSANAAQYDAAAHARIGTDTPGFKDVRLVSQGDIRFLRTAGTNPPPTTLYSPWDLTLEGAQIYPATGVQANVFAGIRNPGYDATLTLGRTTDAIPDAPQSVFGTLTLAGDLVVQGGVVRAPFGKVTLGSNDPNNRVTDRVEVLPGSLTSVSMAGLVIPYGGTVDGVTYTYNGAPVVAQALASVNVYKEVAIGINLNARDIDVQGGATLDLSGGGTLAGAGFISGRGGSVNVLNTPLVNANPTFAASRASDKVYAIVPGYASGYAPVAPEKGAGDPAIGQQVTIGAGVPGLPAGTYTLLPSNYALLPGAFRVEVGQALPASSSSSFSGAGASSNGTYVTSGTLGIANTGVRGSTPSTLLVTPGSVVRSYSQYDEQSYSDFLRARAAQFGGLRPLLPEDGKTLMLTFQPPAASGTPGSPNAPHSAFTFDGTALMQAAQGGFGGQAVTSGVGEIYADAPTAGLSGASVSAAALNAIDAPRLGINGFISGGVAGSGGQSTFFAVNGFGGDVNIRDGVTLRAGEILLVGDNINVGKNVTLSTVGRGDAPFDSLSTGLVYQVGGSAALILSNGELDFVGSSTTGRGVITVGAGSSLYSEGTLAFATNGSASLDPGAHFGARNISLAVGSLNIGSTGDIAGGNAPAGLSFDQALFDTLLHGDPLHGAPTLEQLTLSAGSSINLYGTTGLDARGSGVDLVLATPAIYGLGAAGDQATLAADRIEWDGIVGQAPPALAAGGPGTGSGTLTLSAGEIELGQFAHLDNSANSRVTYGFADVNLEATERITAAGNTALYVYQAPSTDAGAVFGQSGTGGNLTLRTPLLTGAQKSIASYTAGGALSVAAPERIAPSTVDSSVAGAEIDLNGDSVAIGSTILLPSGKLVVQAAHDIALQDGSRIDLSGQPTVIQRATVYGFGGIASFESAQGGITQTAGSVVDVSATQANAGSITVTAANGAVALAGALQGTADEGYTSADFSATGATIDDFDGLNARLTTGGIFDARSFDVKTGNLSIGDGVKAHAVNIAVDDGTLTVTGTIDASGAKPGTIRLSAQGDLTLASSAVLDAHGTVLQVDSHGQPIEAKNRGHIELSTTQGTLRLQPNATMDLSTPNGMAYGDVQLNAPRTGETSGDIAIDAAGPLNIRGAYGIALNAMWAYDLPGGSVITQGTLDGYDTQSQAFIAAAYGGNAAAGALTANLQGKLAGLLAQGNAFHLRPGVQITSSGDLSTSGDINLAGYRYGPGADRDLNSATYGAGEAMALVIRAAGNLDIKGSISDGFGPLAGLPATGPSQGNPVAAGSWLDTTLVFTDTIVFLSEWVVPEDPYYQNTVQYMSDYATGMSYFPGDTVPAGAQFLGDGYNAFEAGVVLPSYANLIPGKPATADQPPTSPTAVLLAAGSQSASLRLVAGADLHAADPRALQATQNLHGSGNLTLSDPNFSASLSGTYLSVVRTGTGGLDLLAGGNFSEATPYGVYTAGTQSAPILAADGSNPYDLIGQVSNSHAWFPEHGGDLLISAQGDVSGNIQMPDLIVRWVNSVLVNNWLWLQGGAGMTKDPAAWSVNFGTLAQTDGYAKDSSFLGFQGIGTLGGGNLTVIAGRNAGVLGSGNTSSGLNLAVASTGRMRADGTLLQTGGGDLVLKVGGTVNPVDTSASVDRDPDFFGAITNLRGDITVDAGAVGQIAQSVRGDNWTSYDPRTLDVGTMKHSSQTPGPTVLPGDGTVRIAARGDLVLGGVGDAGMSPLVKFDGMPFTPSGGSAVSATGGETHFTLWTPDTSISLYSAGGDVAPRTGNREGNFRQNANGFYPGTLVVAAANGDIRFSEPPSAHTTSPVLELIPSPDGQLELLAAGSIYGSGRTVAMSGADMDSLATPFRPVFSKAGTTASNAPPDAAYRLNIYSPIAFGEDTPVSNLHADDAQPARVYAGIDIDDLTIGSVQRPQPSLYSGFDPEHLTWYVAAKPVQVIAGRDIVGTGTTPSTFVNNGAADISLLQAGRDILVQSVTVAGPGLLQVQAGRNLYQGYSGSLESVGPLYGVNSTSRDGGAGISVLVGVGAQGPDYTDFAKLYLDAAHQADTTSGHPLADQPGKVAKTYDQELDTWLQQRFGYAGPAQGALAYFLALPSEQQGVFARQVYYAELTASGREYNDPASTRFGSYLRGRQAIAALFPSQDARGQALSYDGDLTMFSSATGTGTGGVPIITDAGIHTDFGGDIQILNPGGQTLIGVEGVAPTAKAGLITQGSGNIGIYSLGSILLGQSRIMTTFGGNILAWSAEGDINAGRGSKTTVVYTPPQRVYDDLGNVTLSPQVPSTGAGIATLNPLPEVPPGDVDLIAPLGTIDAGEAGIRVSGNVNLAALQVVNAANIQVQGKSTGLPVVTSVNVGALTTASAAAAQATVAAQDAVQRERDSARQALPSIFTVRVLGFGNESAEPSAPAGRGTKESPAAYDPNGAVQVLGQLDLSEQQLSSLTATERRNLRR